MATEQEQRQDITIHPFTHDPNTAWQMLQVKQIVETVKPLSRKKPISPKKVRFVCLSDTHSKTSRMPEAVPDGDVLIHAGDFSEVGHPKQIEEFNQFLGTLPHKHKIVIAGNHDLMFDDSMSKDEDSRLDLQLRFRLKHDEVSSFLAAKGVSHVKQLLTNCTYLEDSETVVHGIRIYGSPWQPEFCDWAFNLNRGQPCLDKWNKIPAGVDVLVTHGPPIGVLASEIPSEYRLSCGELLFCDTRTEYCPGDINACEPCKNLVCPDGTGCPEYCQVFQDMPVAAASTHEGAATDGISWVWIAAAIITAATIVTVTAILVSRYCYRRSKRKRKTRGPEEIPLDEYPAGVQPDRASYRDFIVIEVPSDADEFVTERTRFIAHEGPEELQSSMTSAADEADATTAAATTIVSAAVAAPPAPAPDVVVAAATTTTGAAATATDVAVVAVAAAAGPAPNASTPAPIAAAAAATTTTTAAATTTTTTTATAAAASLTTSGDLGDVSSKPSSLYLAKHPLSTAGSQPDTQSGMMTPKLSQSLSYEPHVQNQQVVLDEGPTEKPGACFVQESQVVWHNIQPSVNACTEPGILDVCGGDSQTFPGENNVEQPISSQYP